MAIKISGSTIIDDSRNIINAGIVTATGNITISKADARLKLYSTDSTTPNYPGIDFDEGNSQGASLELNIFDVELPTPGLGLIVKKSAANIETGTLSFNVLGNIYAGVGVATTNLYKVLTTADEGSGNGLDADTLDGEHKSYYRNASNLNNGTIPDGQFPNTLPAISGASLTNVDADKLDGVEGVNFLRSDIDDDGQGFGSRGNINSSGDPGLLITNGGRLGFDQTGTRSWTIKASGGNLNVASGDGNGYLTGQINSTTLDSIDSTSFLRSDVDDDFTGTLRGNGIGGTYFNLRGGSDSDTKILRVSAADNNEDISSNDDSDYGFNIRYRGDLSGVENALQIDADNQTGTSIESLRIKQDGVVHFGRDVIINGLTVGIGARDPLTYNVSNTAIGSSALYSNTTGYYNTANGYEALYSNTEGDNNTANGYQALYSNTTGQYNTANGYQALYNNESGIKNEATGAGALYSNTTGVNNTATGHAALYYNTTGYYNVATGSGALGINTTGHSNVATGYAALNKNTTGHSNVATGYAALNKNTIGEYNVANGRDALHDNEDGFYNTATGYAALYENISGYYNTATGSNALYNNVGGFFNTATGNDALHDNESGFFNTSNGYQTLYNNESGNYNTATGSQSLISNTTGENNVAIGYQAGYYIEGSNNTIIGGYKGTSADSSLSDTVIISAGNTERARCNSSGTWQFANATFTGIVSATEFSGSGVNNFLREDSGFNKTLGNVTFNDNVRLQFGTGGLDSYVMHDGSNLVLSVSTGLLQVDGDVTINNLTVGRGAGDKISNTGIGGSALYSNTTGNYNTANGYEALLSNTTGVANVATGAGALGINSSGNFNTANGYQALYENTTGDNNTANGARALYKNITGDYNTANGYQALFSNTTGVANVAIGAGALGINTGGTKNTATGYLALYYNTTGHSNVATGYQALESNTTGHSNVAIGYEALESNTIGDYNTATGAGALDSNTNGNKNTATGASALGVNTSGYYNTATGWGALSLNSTGASNVANGYAALYKNTTGHSNLATGYKALHENITGIGNVAVGKFALYYCTGSGNIGIGVLNSAGQYRPVFGSTTEDNRLVLGHTAITNAYVKVAWTVTSDERDKMNFAPVPYGLDFVNQLKPTAFQFKVDRDIETPNGPVHYGFKAQDILALEGDNPVIIDTEDADHLKYKGEHLVPVLVNAVQELTTMVKDLSAKVAVLEARIATLEGQ